MNKLQQLKKITKIVADSGDFNQIQKYSPDSATTNPSLILKAILMPKYKNIIKTSISKSNISSKEKKLKDILMNISVEFGLEILKIIPGKVSIEVDSRLSFNTEKTIKYANDIINKYSAIGINKNRILIKIISTWEGIKAAEFLEKQGINCNLTLIFSLVQAIACAQSKVYLISPFIGRITSWHMNHKNNKNFPKISKDQGILSFKSIYKYYKKFNYSTIVMGASFRHIKQIEALAGCEALTISPNFLNDLSCDYGYLTRMLNKKTNDIILNDKNQINKINFKNKIDQNIMAKSNIQQGIKQFNQDIIKLENLIKQYI